MLDTIEMVKNGKKGQFFSGDPRIQLGGRPKGSKNKLTVVKDRLVELLDRALDDPVRANAIDVGTLIRFTASVMPKDVSLRLKPDLTYIDSVPRKSIAKPRHKAKVIIATATPMTDDSRPTTPTIAPTTDSEPSTADATMVDNSKALPEASPIPATPLKVASTASLKEKKYGEGKGKKEVVSKPTSPEISKIQ